MVEPNGIEPSTVEIGGVATTHDPSGRQMPMGVQRGRYSLRWLGNTGTESHVWARAIGRDDQEKPIASLRAAIPHVALDIHRELSAKE